MTQLYRCRSRQRDALADCRADLNRSIIAAKSAIAQFRARECGQQLSWRMKMRNTLLLVVIGSAASAVLAAATQLQPTQLQPKLQPAPLQPLNVQTGLWRMTKAVTWTGLPPQ